MDIADQQDNVSLPRDCIMGIQRLTSTTLNGDYAHSIGHSIALNRVLMVTMVAKKTITAMTMMMLTNKVMTMMIMRTIMMMMVMMIYIR